MTMITRMKILLIIILLKAVSVCSLPKGMPRLPTFWFMSPLLLEDLGSQDDHQVDLPDASKLMYAYGRFCRAECHEEVDGDGRSCSKICTVCTVQGCDTTRDYFQPPSLLLGRQTDVEQSPEYEDPAEYVYRPEENAGLYRDDYNGIGGVVDEGEIDARDLYESDAGRDDYEGYIAAVGHNGPHQDDPDPSVLEDVATTTATTSTTTTTTPPPLALKWPEIKKAENTASSGYARVHHGHTKFSASSFAGNKFSF